MRVLAKRSELRRLALQWRSKGETVGFVPTMGALHEGHASLIRRARRRNRRVVVSIFVNPAQFGPGEDFARYPRTLAEDLKLCAAEGVDVVYHPSAREIYPQEFGTFVEVSSISNVLEGAIRPGHFKGVATVVLKLLETVRPDRAYFGEKDYQQLVIVRRMAKDLDLACEIVGCPTVRERDGLALSSRNRYLSPKERRKAPRLYAALRAAASKARLGPGAVVSAARRELSKIPGAALDYVSLVDGDSLRAPSRASRSLRLLAAVRIGNTRLIDNIPVSCYD